MIAKLALVGAGAALGGLGLLAFEWPEGCDAMVAEFKQNETMTELFGTDVQVVSSNVNRLASFRRGDARVTHPIASYA
jgi:hypothetical protein